jgi:carbon storage regulator
MLVLSRKIGEVITVGSSVKITVLSFDRGVVRLGIEAPKSVPVHRKEVHDKIIEMNKLAARTQIDDLKNALNESGVIFSVPAKDLLSKSLLILDNKTSQKHRD